MSMSEKLVDTNAAPQADSAVSGLPPSSFSRKVYSEGASRLIAVGWGTLAPITFFLIGLVWWASVVFMEIPSYLLPNPIDVIIRMFADWELIWRNAQFTVTAIVLGFGITIVTAIPLGLIIALSKVAKQTLYPPMMLLQLVPKIAVAPLFLVWLGFGIESKVLLTILMTFFPLLLASISGFQILDDRLLYLTKSMGASTWQTFRFLRFPSALPVIFSGLKASATIAATAAIVAEFVGSNNGLGYVLLRGTSTLDTEIVFAVLVVLTLIGIAINYSVEFAEWIMTPWQRAKTT